MSRVDPVEAAIREHGRALLAYFARRIHPVEDAADLVAETVAGLGRRRRDLPADPVEAGMWMFGIARGVLANQRRSIRRRGALVERLRGAVVLADADRPAELDEVREAVDALPAPLAEVIRLVHWDGFGLESAAEHLGIPASTARGRHQRAKALLREALALPVDAPPTQPSRMAATTDG